MARAPHPSLASDPVAALDPEPFRKALASWYRKHARDLPWRGVHDPYATWLSEIMLQQTRVATVIERYTEFLGRFPTLADLAHAPEDAVLALWSGLGYYRRARMLHRGAQFVVRELRGELPRTSTALRTLPGIGEYTAAAIASIAFGERIPVLDGNVERVLFRLLGLPEDRTAAAHAALLRTAAGLLPPAPRRLAKTNPPGDHNQAMMELGATVCLPRAPLCLQCPVFAFCRTRGEHPTAGRPALRSRQVACLLATRKRGTATEVLLERRPAAATLMPGMLELPPLPLDAVAGREPVLRLRHSITNTNYYVEVYAEGAVGAAVPAASPESGIPGEQTTLPLSLAGAEAHPFRPGAGEAPEDEVFRAEPGDLARTPSLQPQIAAAAADLFWCPAPRLPHQPLTGLARKALQRLGLMQMSSVRVRGAGSV